MARLCPLFSGSTGNSYYIGSRSSGVLVDAGRSAKQLDNMLRLCQIDPLAIQGIFITHEHTDHISALRVFAGKYDLPVFLSPGTLQAAEDSLPGVKLIPLEGEVEVGDLKIRPFHTSHDCAEPLGFRITTEDHRIVGFATDLGYLSQEVREGLLGADAVVLESNHDVSMLTQGNYPYSLKKRILSQEGHLSNDTCAAFLPELHKSGTKRFLLGHLSRENNTRAAALETSGRALVQAGLVEKVDYVLDAARPENLDGQLLLF